MYVGQACVITNGIISNKLLIPIRHFHTVTVIRIAREPLKGKMKNHKIMVL